MRTDDLHLHVRGDSVFLDDLAAPAGCLEAAVVTSSIAHGHITGIDFTAALAADGVVKVLTAVDVPGENQIGPIIPDEPLLADGTVHHIGQAIAVVLAKTRDQARAAANLVTVEYDPLPAILDAREAHAQDQLIQPPRTFALGDIDAAWDDCAVVVSGRTETGGQEHFYLETQAAMSVPTEDRTLIVHSSTQSPTGVQKTISRVLGIPMHGIEIDVRRLGGAFGGKEDQASLWAALAALGTHHTNRPVRLVLDRAEDMVRTGKRHPYDSDYRLGLDQDGRILAFEVSYFQNAGASADLSTCILERTLFHSTNTYRVPNVKATAYSCRTNITPFTAFRGFGGPQAMFVMEAALERAAGVMNRPVHELQRLNLLSDGDVFPYGMKAEDCRAERCWDHTDESFGFDKLRQSVDEHNASHAATKRGMAVMPICFGISFTNTALNQARSLIHVYHDGSINVSTGAVEMGQGVNRKIRKIVAHTLGVNERRVRLDTSNTSRVANTSPTAASTGSDLNGAAARIACLQILERLRRVAAERLDDANVDDVTIADDTVQLRGSATLLGWEELVQAAYWSRTDLSAHGHYATPYLDFDKESETGNPFAYHVYGTAVTEVTLDCLRGTTTIDAVRIVHDGGRSIDLLTDRGQVEGALAQGLGWMLLEALVWNDDGRLINDTASKYKVPDIGFMPDQLDIRFLEDADNPKAVLNSKAVGEPPFMYGIGVYFALRDALKAARPDRDPDHTTPLTPEHTLMWLAGPDTNATEETTE
jgi:xanthine dehydrogenase large subunit